ncbi:MAG TPA: patatin-like phospholipase family protein [Acidimicrobiales bacterium]|nr:patatin-like phospholipase family protein [Acidimicrobiales bacterium]
MAVVLGGGGPVGYAFHAGVLAALADGGFDARSAGLLVGTSIGAATAGLLRAGMSPHDLSARVARTQMSAEGVALLERAGGWPTFPAPADVVAARWGRPASPALLGRLLRAPGRVRPGLLIAALANAGTVDAGPIADGLDRAAGGTWPAAATWVCAVDLDAGERVVFGAPGGPAAGLGTAVAASCAVPSYFRPVEVGGRRFVDGGVHSPANTDLVGALAAGPTRPAAVVVSLPMGITGRPGRFGVDLPGRHLNTRGARRGLAPLVAAGVPVVLVAPTARELRVMGYDAFDRSRLDEVARRARRSTTERLAEGRRRGDAAVAVLDAAAAAPGGVLAERP